MVMVMVMVLDVVWCMLGVGDDKVQPSLKILSSFIFAHSAHLGFVYRGAISI